jgi:hypothetical protein
MSQMREQKLNWKLIKNELIQLKVMSKFITSHG